MDVHSNYSSDEILPRVLIVSRRTIRKNKFVDFVGEYHLDLIVKYGAVPIIVPRVTGIHSLLSNFDPIHGVLLCEGEDIDPSHYNTTPTSSTLTSSELDEIRSTHISDTSIDTSKDSIELNLAKLCLQRNIPYLGICRGSQVINVACGGTLYQDVEMELHNKMGKPRVVHMDYENYDGHRHVVRVEQGTPLADWFSEEWEDGEEMELMVNSYHHQGVKKLADRFVPMAFAEDGLIEGFYDRDGYDPGEGKFIMGLQFHPERMRKNNDDGEFDYAGCPTAYKEFVRAVMAYEKKVRINATATTHVPRGMFNISPTTKINWEMENKRKIIVRSFSLEKDMYIGAGYHHRTSAAASEGNILEVNTTALISLQQEQRLKQMGATVRNGCAYLGSLKKMNDEKERIARSIIGKMSTEHLSEMVSFYYMMGQICSEVFETKIKLHSM